MAMIGEKREQALLASTEKTQFSVLRTLANILPVAPAAIRSSPLIMDTKYFSQRGCERFSDRIQTGGQVERNSQSIPIGIPTKKQNRY
ncbi:hypothetical protein [Pseudomonas hormoni]